MGKKIYILLCAFVCSLFFLGLTDVYADDLPDQYVYIQYSGPTKTYAEGTVSEVTISHNTYFKYTFHGFDPSWHLVYDVGSSLEPQVKVWNGYGYLLTLNSPTIVTGGSGTNIITPHLHGTYSTNATGINFYVGGANLYLADFNYNGVFDISSEQVKSWSSTDPGLVVLYGLTSAEHSQFIKIVGIPTINSDTMDDDFINNLVASYDYNYTPPVPDGYAYPVLEEVSKGTLSSQIFSFNENSATDILYKNLVVTSSKTDNDPFVKTDTGLHSFSGTYLGYNSPHERYVNVSVVQGKPKLIILPSAISLDVLESYKLDTIEFDIAYAYNTNISSFVHIKYNANTGEVVQNVVGTQPTLPNINGDKNNGFITNPDTQVTGSELLNIFTNWLDNISTSLSTFSNALLSFANGCVSVASAIGTIYTNIFGEYIGNLIIVSITCAFVLRIFGR